MRYLTLLICLTTLPAAQATNWYVQSGQQLQPIIDTALPGDTITLQAGATFTGNFILPEKTGSSWITIRSSMMSSLPPSGTRINPSYVPFMAKLMSLNTSPALPALAAAAGAHNYRIIGLELASPPGVTNINVVQLGTGKETSIADLPSYIILDRLYIHGDPVSGALRGVLANSRYTNIVNCYISDIKHLWADSQAVEGWNGPGPFQIINNYLEASGENIMFGGGRTSIANMVPTNIVIKNNHLFKPLSWKKDDPTYAGTPWVVKNSFELKNAKYVTFDGNVVENCWPMAQAGFAVQLTVRTEHGTMPWAVVQNVTLSDNVFRNVYAGMNILGRDGTYGGITRGITISNNLFESMPGWWLTLLSGWSSVLIDHNTVAGNGAIIIFDGVPGVGLTYRNNITPRGASGIFGSGKSEGTIGLAYYAPNAVVTRNIIAGANAGIYPAGNYFPPSLAAVGFVNMAANDYELATSSPYVNLGTDGKNLGVDCTALQLATANVVQ